MTEIPILFDAFERYDRIKRLRNSKFYSEAKFKEESKKIVEIIDILLDFGINFYLSKNILNEEIGTDGLNIKKQKKRSITHFIR